MRRARGVVALLSSVLLGLVLIAAAQPGPVHAPDVGKGWAAAARPGDAGVPAPLVAKRWS
jgi:hypothetical protein